MRVLFVPNTIGFGHIARAKATIDELSKEGVECGILTNKEGEQFSRANKIDAKVDPSFYGMSYSFAGGNRNRLDIMGTLGRLAIDSPKYVADYCRIIGKACGKDGYDLVINDFTPHLTRIPGANVINVMHYAVPTNFDDVRRIFSDPQSLFYEGLILPSIKMTAAFTNRFRMDLRRSRIDYSEYYPPIVSKVERTRMEIRKELDVTGMEKLIVDGRSNPPLNTYGRLSEMHPDLKFFVRAQNTGCAGIKSKGELVPNMVDYISAADLFVTKPGFSMMSEAVVAGTPMLFERPEFHFEGLTNMRMAEAAGYGKPIDCLEDDVIAAVDRLRHGGLPNGLPYLTRMIREVSETKPLLRRLMSAVR
ncbi:Uncharacterised protein [uncultured archaeon]|nr:Uncharacterised protein [uncultured archaeon]